MKKVKLLYNPFSGDNAIIKNLDNIFKIYQENGYSVTPFRIGKKFPLEDAFKDAHDYEHLLLAGGDGTINNIVNTMKRLNITCPVGILPTGTANDFALCLGMPKDISKACEQIINSEVREIDLGVVNDKYFVNVASMGLFTEVSQRTNVNLKNNMGKLAYYFSGITELPRFKKLNINIISDEFTFNEPSIIVFVFNGKSAGNFNIAYKSQIDDGMLDVVIVKGEVGANTLISFFEFVMGEHLEKPKGVIHFTTNKLVIDSAEDIRTDIDGERGPDFPLNISCQKRSLKVLGYKL